MVIVYTVNRLKKLLMGCENLQTIARKLLKQQLNELRSWTVSEWDVRQNERVYIYN